MTSVNRRDFLANSGQGFGALALSAMFVQDEFACTEMSGLGRSGVLKAVHHPPKVKRVVQLFMGGAASHIDLFDHKPELEKHHGEPSDFGEYVEAFQNGLGPWMKSPFAFQKYDECGKTISEVVTPFHEISRMLNRAQGAEFSWGTFSTCLLSSERSTLETCST